jgi:hypothetical protein
VCTLLDPKREIKISATSFWPVTWPGVKYQAQVKKFLGSGGICEVRIPVYATSSCIQFPANPPVRQRSEEIYVRAGVGGATIDPECRPYVMALDLLVF